MRIEFLKLCDFGVFCGEHLIDLAPRTKYGKTRPITLFGGLNGSGKTTILNAVRLALYGKQALGRTVSQKDYQQHLRDCIHKSSSRLVQCKGASISLEFTHSNLGELSRYRVERSWTINGSGVKELLILFRNGTQHSEISSEQCQSFLNELVPIGVSDLFFFDGERIAQLAEEDGNVALGDAIKRLLGIDLIDRLRSDLSIYVTRQYVGALPDKIKAERESLQHEYTRLLHELDNQRSQIAELTNTVQHHEHQLAKLEDILSSKGGAWVNQRAELKGKLQQLEYRRSEVEGELRSELAGLYPLSLAPELLRAVQIQLLREAELKNWMTVSTHLRSQLPQLEHALAKILPPDLHSAANKVLENTFADFLNPPDDLSKVQITHDLSATESERVRYLLNEALSLSAQRVFSLREDLESIEASIAAVSLQIDRAPDTATIQNELVDIKAEQAALAEFRTKKEQCITNAKQSAWHAMELNRRIRRLQAEFAEAANTTATANIAERTRALLFDFATETRQRKIKVLERAFEETFAALARKDDLLVKATIDPENFDVTLYGKEHRIIEKKQLSAGEKQIFAIAMLQALSRTSGRALPMIIDTPLGRLDSKHRNKLIERYFPRASHQVIILATDTEIDQKFYNLLRPYVSRAFNISYNNAEGASEIHEGYFWRDIDEMENYAS